MSRRGILKGSCRAGAPRLQGRRGIQFSFRDVCHLAGFWVIHSRIGAGFRMAPSQRRSAGFRAFQRS